LSLKEAHTEATAAGDTADLERITMSRIVHGLCTGCGGIPPCDCGKTTTTPEDRQKPATALCPGCNGDGTGPNIRTDNRTCEECRTEYPLPAQVSEHLTEYHSTELHEQARGAVQALMKQKRRGIRFLGWSLVIREGADPTLRAYYLHPDGTREFLNVAI
jgi:hypothetical protein